MFRKIIKSLIWGYCWARYGRRKPVMYNGPFWIHFEPDDAYRKIIERWLVPNQSPTVRTHYITSPQNRYGPLSHAG